MRARSPAAAMAWQFRTQHQWGLLALLTFLAALAVIKVLVVMGATHIRLDTPASFAFVVVVPTTAMFTYALAVFSFGYAGDFAARRSIFPSRLFTLPVTNSALAGWPMLYGTIAMIVMWCATRFLALWPPDLEVPLLWPALLGASLLAWTQALTWLPYGFAGARVAVIVLWLSTFDAIVLVALHFHAREPVMVAILAPHVPLAFLAARSAVSRARRGEVPDWSGLFSGVANIIDVRDGTARPFRSARRAQVWLEWNEHGRSLPMLVAMLLPFELALLWTARDAVLLTFEIVIGVLITPPIVASFTAATVRRSGTSESYGVTPFIATRPLTSAELIAAKLEATCWSTLATWALVLAAVPPALAWSGTSRLVNERLHALADVVGGPHAFAFAAIIIAGCIASTWRQLVQSLYIGLTGRAWLIKGSVFATLAIVALLGPAIQWLVDRRLVGTMWSATPWILWSLVVVKMSLGSSVIARLCASRVLSDRGLLSLAAAWVAAVLALFGVLNWLLSSPLVADYLLMLIAMLAMPLVRLAATPLALAWNRHR